MTHNFTRTRKCAICGAKTKADRAVPLKQVFCETCRHRFSKTTPTVPASEPEGDSK